MESAIEARKQTTSEAVADRPAGAEAAPAPRPEIDGFHLVI